MSVTPSANPNILVVEDNTLDALLLKVALKEGGFTNDPVVVEDGRPALDLLQRSGFFAEYAVPDLVILDLDLKRVDGPAVLDFIRQAPNLEHVRVAVVSCSPPHVMMTRATGADGYFTKPSDLVSYQQLGKDLMDCYLGAPVSR
jgi:CheY-like chemotaxis protein